MKRLLAALAALFCVQAASADMLVDNVNGYTIGADREVVRFNAMLVGTDGRPVARGLVAYDAAELPDLLGRSTRELGLREVVHRDDLVLVRSSP